MKSKHLEVLAESHRRIVKQIGICRHGIDIYRGGNSIRGAIQPVP